MKGEVQLKHVRTNRQVANIMTKSLPSGKHEYFRLKMGLTSFEARGRAN